MALALCVLVVACSPVAEPRKDEAVGPVGAETAPTEPPSRLLTLAPNLTETVFALGLGHVVVGVDDYSNFPPEAAEKPRVGGLFNPNFEAMVALEPDLAILLPSEADIGERLRRVGVDVLVVESETIDDIAEGMISIAERCAIPEVGRRLAKKYRDALVAETARGDSEADDPIATGPDGVAGDDEELVSAPRVMITVGRESGHLGEILIAGPNTFLDELLARLGAVNAFADAPVRYPQVGLEEILVRSPTVIVELNAGEISRAQREALTEDWQAYPQIPAVAEGRIEILGADYTLVPGPRLPLLFDRLRDMLAAGEAR